MPPVDFAEQGVIHTTTWKLPLEVPDTVLEGESRLPLQGFTIGDPLDLMRLQEFETESFSTFELLEWDLWFFEWAEFLHERQILETDLFVSQPDVIRDGMSWDLEDLAKDFIWNICRMAWFINNLPELQLHNIEELLFTYLLHQLFNFHGFAVFEIWKCILPLIIIYILYINIISVNLK